MLRNLVVKNGSYVYHAIFLVLNISDTSQVNKVAKTNLDADLLINRNYYNRKSLKFIHFIKIINNIITIIKCVSNTNHFNIDLCVGRL